MYYNIVGLAAVFGEKHIKARNAMIIWIQHISAGTSRYQCYVYFISGVGDCMLYGRRMLHFLCLIFYWWWLFELKQYTSFCSFQGHIFLHYLTVLWLLYSCFVEIKFINSILLILLFQCNTKTFLKCTVKISVIWLLTIFQTVLSVRKGERTSCFLLSINLQ